MDLDLDGFHPLNRSLKRVNNKILSRAYILNHKHFTNVIDRGRYAGLNTPRFECKC
jgi:hypothetical protein